MKTVLLGKADKKILRLAKGGERVALMERIAGTLVLVAHVEPTGNKPPAAPAKPAAKPAKPKTKAKPAAKPKAARKAAAGPKAKKAKAKLNFAQRMAAARAAKGKGR